VIKDYIINFNLLRTGEIEVEERILANFSKSRHGIFRKISYKYENARGFEYKLRFSDFKIEDKKGNPREFERHKGEKYYS